MKVHFGRHVVELTIISVWVDMLWKIRYWVWYESYIYNW